MREIIRKGEVPVVAILGKTLLLERDLEAYVRSRYGTLRVAERKSRPAALPQHVRESVLLRKGA
jgi:hypothetical protein